MLQRGLRSQKHGAELLPKKCVMKLVILKDGYACNSTECPRSTFPCQMQQAMYKPKGRQNVHAEAAPIA